MRPSDDPPTPREAALRQRIRDVYAAFRGYRLDPHLGEAAYAPDAVDANALRADALDRLPASAFADYQWRAVTTWGRVDDLKHFLPRMLEIVATQPQGRASVGVEGWLVFGRLRYCEWPRWPARERDAVAAYFDALWAALLARPVELGEDAWRGLSLGDWLKALAEAHADLSPFIERWKAEANEPGGPPTAAAHLAFSLLEMPHALQKKGRLDWWPIDGSREHERQAMDWIASADAQAALERAFFRWPDSPYAAMISTAHDRLAAWRLRWAADA